MVESTPATSADQRQQLAPRVGRTRPVTKIHYLVGDLLDPSRSASVAGSGSPAGYPLRRRSVSTVHVDAVTIDVHIPAS
jgi:hypothetical protein